MTLDEITRHLIYDFESETEIVSLINTISENFTQKREKIGQYILDRKMVAAYTCFYFSTNRPKLAAVLKKAEIDFDLYRDCEFIDIGSGPGTFISALLELDESCSVIGIEKSEYMREQAFKLIKGLHGREDIEVVADYKKIPEKKKVRFGIFGHSANEMDPDLILKIIEKAELDHVLFMEPGTKSFFNKSLVVRRKLISDKYFIHYPCPGQKNCPMESSRDWCHQYIRLAHDPAIERLTQKAKKDRRLLPMTIHFYSRERNRPRGGKSIISRVYRPTKFGVEWQFCRLEDDSNSLVDIQIMNKGLSKSEIKERQAVMSGDRFEVEMEKEVGPNKFRGKIK